MAAATIITPTTRGTAREEVFMIALRFNIPSVAAASASGYYEIQAIPSCGKIVRFKAKSAGASTSYHIELGDVDEFTSQSLDTIFRVENCDTDVLDVTGAEYYYVNQSTEEEGSFFVKVTNADVANATGIISVEVTIAVY